MLTAAAGCGPAEGGLCILVHPGQWEPGLPGEPDGVGVLGSGDEVFTVDASHLYPALTIGKVYDYVAAFCDGAADRVVAHAEGSGLPHEEPGEALAVAGEDQGAGLVSAAATLHHDGFEPGVEGAGREETLYRSSEKLAWRVIDVGLQYLDCTLGPFELPDDGAQQ